MLGLKRLAAQSCRLDVVEAAVHPRSLADYKLESPPLALVEVGSMAQSQLGLADSSLADGLDPLL